MDYAFVLRGTMPLLMHGDDVEAADELSEWRKSPKNKSVSTPGDDRSPAWTWTTYVYHDGAHLAIPQEMLMAALRIAGAKIMAKGKSTFKSLTQSGLLIGSDFCQLTNNGKPVAIDWIQRLRAENATFREHVETAKRHGIVLAVKRAKVGAAKHVRVRPRLDDWTVRGTITVSEPAITHDVLVQLFELAGRFAGLGDWRPSSPSKPGPYGMFTADVEPTSKRRSA